MSDYLARVGFYGSETRRIELDQDMMASASHFQGQLTGGWTSDKRDEVLAAYQYLHTVCLLRV